MVCLLCREGENVDAGTETDSNLNQQLYYHFLGTDQSEDILCWRDPENPKHFVAGGITDDGKVNGCHVWQLEMYEQLGRQSSFHIFFPCIQVVVSSNFF